MAGPTREIAAPWDAEDPLAPCGARFVIPGEQADEWIPRHRAYAGSPRAPNRRGGHVCPW